MYEEEDDVSLSSDSEISPPQIEKRQYHNLLERNRRNILKSSFSRLKNAIPPLAKRNSKGASRAKILKRSIEFIRRSELKKSARDRDIRDLKAENKILEDQIRAMECITDSTSLGSIESLLQRISGTDFKSHSAEPTDSEEESNDSDSEGLEEESRYSEDCYEPRSKRARQTSSEDDVNTFSSSFETQDPSQGDLPDSDSETTDTDSEVGEE